MFLVLVFCRLLILFFMVDIIEVLADYPTHTTQQLLHGFICNLQSIVNTEVTDVENAQK